MGVVEELAGARADYERGDWVAAYSAWSTVDQAVLGADDLVDVGVAAFLLGHRDESVRALQRAYHLRVGEGDVAGAVRVAFRLAMVLATGGEPALFAGWTARAERLLADLPDGGRDTAERGYVAFLRLHRALGTGDFVAATELASEVTAVGRDLADPDLLALGLCSSGRLSVYAGQVAEGLALLDEAMVGVLTGELHPVIAGRTYCTAIEGCQEIGAMDRVAAWTSALRRWCSEQPGLLEFTGQCAVHHGQVLRLRGAWPAAVAELVDARRRYEAVGSHDAVGQAERERGDLLGLTGDLDGAEDAYEEATAHGCDPQPGLALVWLARGRRDAARSAVQRALAEIGNPVARVRLLPAAVEVLLADGCLDDARACVAELDGLATAFGSDPLLATAAQAHALMELEDGDPAGALPYARKAHQLWTRVNCPFEAARVRVLTGRAMILLGDEESGRRDLHAALDALHRLGAAIVARQVERLLSPGSLPGGLTAREVEVLRLVAGGRSNTRIAADLVLSEKTVARHLSNIFTKLGVTSRTAAAAFAFEHDLT